MDRRDFLKISAAAGVAVSATACGFKKAEEPLGDIDPLGHHTGEIPTDRMTYRTSQTNGDKVSLLGYGWMRLPTLPLPEGAEDSQMPELDQEQINRLCRFALDHGVNYYDTSPVYCKGRSEASLGTALKASGYDRSKYFIATKLSNFAPELQSYEEGVKMFRNSLKYLQTDYIDYMLLHAIGGGGKEVFEQRYINNGILDFLMEQRKKGTVRQLGFSYHGDMEFYDYLMSLHDKYHWDFVQIQLNYVDWKYGDGEHLYNELLKRNIPAIIMEPLLGGRLAKVPDHVVAHLKQREPENSVASWAFRYCGTKPNVLTVLSGMTYMEHLEDNLRSYCPLEPLTDEEVDWLEGETATLINNYPTVPCTGCQYCMPCPYGIDIPGIFAHYNSCVNKGNVPESREAKNYAEARRTYLTTYNKAIPTLRQADHCIDCRQCNSHCPQKIDIPMQMQRIDQFVEKLKQNTL